MKKLLCLFSLFLPLLTALPAQACYNKAEFEAEQGLRIHSELMVIGLTCMKMPQGPALYDKYRRFTSMNSDLIAGYENELIQHYGSHGEEKLHTLRTNLANEISRRAATMGATTFCSKYASHLDQALAMDRSKLHRWAQHVWPGQPTTERMCQI